MNDVQDMLPFLLPLILIQLGLIVFALLDLARRPHTKGPKWVWVLLILFVQFIGPLSYFMIGREE